MKYFVNGYWCTELGRRIRLNDLVRDMHQYVKELNSMTTIEEAVKKAHDKGLRVSFHLEPRKRKL